MQYENIITGYRKDCNVIDAYKSLFVSFHNESINAWSMVIGVGAIAYLCITSPNTNIYQILLLIGLSIHLPLSFSYHALSCTKYAQLARHFDICGVVITSSILAIAISGRFFGFKSYITLCLALCGFFISWFAHRTNKFEIEQDDTTSICKNQRRNTAIIIGMAVFIYNIPIIYAMIYLPEKRTLAIVEILMFLIAGIIYASGFPEKMFPVTFDLIGNSHNIAHVFLIIQQIIIWYILKTP